MTIIKNSAKCNKCEQEIESKHRHDYVRCRCDSIAVDGGKEYLRRAGDDYTDTSITTDQPTWTTFDNRTVLVSELTDDHLNNIAYHFRQLNRNPPAIILAEAAGRGLLNLGLKQVPWEKDGVMVVWNYETNRIEGFNHAEHDSTF